MQQPKHQTLGSARAQVPQDNSQEPAQVPRSGPAPASLPVPHLRVAASAPPPGPCQCPTSGSLPAPLWWTSLVRANVLLFFQFRLLVQANVVRLTRFRLPYSTVSWLALGYLGLNLLHLHPHPISHPNH